MTEKNNTCHCFSGGYPVNAKIIEIKNETETGKRTLYFDTEFSGMNARKFLHGLDSRR